MQNKPLIFQIPPGYKRLFVLMSGDFKYIMQVTHEGISVQDTRGITEKQSRMVSDFIGDSISQVRLECSK